MLDGNATGSDEEASHTTLQHHIVSAEANTQFSQHSLNELLLGEEILTPISSQLHRPTRRSGGLLKRPYVSRVRGTNK
jgi:hypothetical protein